MSEFSIIFIDDNFNAMSTLVQTMSVEFPQADVSRIFNDPDKGVQYVLDNLYHWCNLLLQAASQQ